MDNKKLLTDCVNCTDAAAASDSPFNMDKQLQEPLIPTRLCGREKPKSNFLVSVAAALATEEEVS